VGHLADVITCAKFQVEIFRGYDFTGGSNFPFSYWFLHGPYNSAARILQGGRISHFPIDFCMGLTTVQRDCAACDTACRVILHNNTSSKSNKTAALVVVAVVVENLQMTQS